jgi:nucleotide-binding universal stress UspA family protein
MKIKPTSNKGGGVVMELGPKEAQMPPRDLAAPQRPLPVFKLKKILVPVDFSECSKKALQYAVPFARQFGAELTLLYVMQHYPLVSEMGPVDVESNEDAERDLEALRQTIDRDVRSRAVVRAGEPHLEITETAKSLGIDLILLSTHGRTGLNHVLMGSTAEKVVRRAGCPVLIVRQHEHEFIAGVE